MQKEALHKISYGMYVLTSKLGEDLNGQISNAVIQVTSDPPQIAAAINTNNYTHECIQGCNSFGVSVLSQETPLSFVGRFGFKGGKEFDKLKNVDYKIGKTGVPIVLENAVAYIEVNVNKKVEIGTHTLFIGNVIDAKILNDEKVMTYEYYHDVKRGTLSKAATHYIEKEDEKKWT